MADALEMALKEAIKKAMVEAAREVQMEGTPCQPAKIAREIKNVRKKAVTAERTGFALRSLGSAGVALLACGFISAVLFAPELASASGASYEAAPVSYSYKSAALTSDTCGGNQPQSFDWKDLASLEKVEQMVKNGAILHARPEDLAAIVIFHELRKMIKGEAIRVDHLEEDFKNSLPCQWHPVYDAVKEEFPTQIPLPPVPVDQFARPKVHSL